MASESNKVKVQVIYLNQNKKLENKICNKEIGLETNHLHKYE